MREEGAKGDHPPVVRGILLEKITNRSSPHVLWLTGFPGATIDRISVSNSTFRGVEAADVIAQAGEIGFSNVTVEPARKSRSLNSLPNTP